METYEGLHIYNEPVVQDVYDFMFSHLGCDCIIERIDSDLCNPVVKIYAYAKKPWNNMLLRKYYFDLNFKPPIKIKRGMDKSEVAAID